VLGLLLAPIAATAMASAPAGLSGVWQGEIGGLPIRACFSTRDSSAFGSYYYERHRRLIALEAEEDSGSVFREIDARDSGHPRWRVERVDGTSLTGSWTQGRRALPVRLTRVAGWESEPGEEGENGPCMSMAFNAPRLAGIEVTQAAASVDGTAYRRLTLRHDGQFEANVETFALERDDAAARRVNAMLSEALAGDPPQWFECVRNALRFFPHEGSFDQRLEPAIISGGWLSVVQNHDSYCGGNHPNGGKTYRTFDLSSGSEVDPLSWFGPMWVERSPPESEEIYYTLRPELRERILAPWRSEAPECDEAIRSQDFWNAGITRQGFVFAPSLPHVIQACGEEFSLSFDSVRDLLTSEGAAAVQAILAD